MNLKDYYEKNFDRVMVDPDSYKVLSGWYKKVYEVASKRNHSSGEGKKLVDIGPELGKYLDKYEDLGFKVHVIDVSEKAVEYHRKKGRIGDVVDITTTHSKFPSNHFDLAIMSEVIEHMFDAQKALDEIYRMLKVNGCLYITTHNTMNLFMRLKYLMGHIPNPLLDVSNQRPKGGHIRIFNSKILKKMLKNAGFTIIEDHSFMTLFDGLEPPMKSLLSQHLFFVARKDSPNPKWKCTHCKTINSNVKNINICKKCQKFRGD